MEKSKSYPRTHFSADVLQEAVTVFKDVAKSTSKNHIEEHYIRLEVRFRDHTLKHDNLSEFLSDYRQAIGGHLALSIGDGFRSEFKLNLCNAYTQEDYFTVAVSAQSRGQIESVFEVFERHAVDSRLPEPEKEKITPTIFIGHGHSESWRDLKDHLHEQHGYSVEAYETGARAGHAIRDIIQDMMSKSAFALLVLTCDDPVGDDKYRARQNVIHEAGLFQGHLGFSRTIILLEDGVEDFSNIAGIHQVRFSKGKIKETFGDVLATVRREFNAVS